MALHTINVLKCHISFSGQGQEIISLALSVEDLTLFFCCLNPLSILKGD